MIATPFRAWAKASEYLRRALQRPSIDGMSSSVYSEINLHITWHTKESLPMIRRHIEGPLYRFLAEKIAATPGARLHAIGGIETHIHIAVSVEPDLLVSDWVGRLKGASAHYINHYIQPKALQWQRGYGVVSFGTRDLKWVVDYVKNQKEHHRQGTIHRRLETGNEKGR